MQRCVYRERKYVCKERMKPHEHASALVREDNRRLLSETLNRQHAWLYRRRYARHYLVYMGLERESEGGGGEKRAHNDIDEKLIGLARGSLAGSSEVRVKEIDSEEDLYAEEFAFTKSASGPPVPLTLAMAEAKGHRPDLVTKTETRNLNPLIFSMADAKRVGLIPVACLFLSRAWASFLLHASFSLVPFKGSVLTRSLSRAPCLHLPRLSERSKPHSRRAPHPSALAV